MQGHLGTIAVAFYADNAADRSSYIDAAVYRQQCDRTGATVHPFKNMAWVCWFDASWCSRADGSSQGGYVICTTEKTALSGNKEKFTVFTGASKKLTR
eukprot:9499604-Pyramimonas_sp.AAC.1